MINCAQCGFPFREGKDVEGESTDSPGILEEVVTTTVNNDQSKLPQPLKGMADFAVTSVDYTFPTITTGCRFCGTTNPRGLTRNLRDYGTGIDLSNK